MPKLRSPNLNDAVREVEKSFMEKAQHLNEVGSLAIAVDVSKAASLIDISRTARAAGDIGSAEASLDRARALLLALLGIE